MWRVTSLALLLGCTAEAQQVERIPERVQMGPPAVARAIDSTHRIVCYVFPNGNGACEKF